jgi:translation initiation factor 2B subunit (eIF-2B alpha/beta/delta family)
MMMFNLVSILMDYQQVGTYQIAVLAKDSNKPLYVIAER